MLGLGCLTEVPDEYIIEGNPEDVPSSRLALEDVALTTNNNRTVK
jgi:hypothetical protein